jgi:histidine triad (HIT) family protein
MSQDCIFCRIIRGESPADFVHRGDSVVIFRDVRPEAPVHLLVVPRKHIRGVNDLEEEDRPIVAEMVFRAKETARELAISRSGYRLILNVERGGGQAIFHLHMHLIGGW